MRENKILILIPVVVAVIENNLINISYTYIKYFKNLLYSGVNVPFQIKYSYR